MTAHELVCRAHGDVALIINRGPEDTGLKSEGEKRYEDERAAFQSGYNLDKLTIYLFSTRRKSAAEMGKSRVAVCRVGGDAGASD